MEEIADVYSRSLFEVAKEHDSLDEIHDQLGEFADALDKDRDLQVFFFSPYFSSSEKQEGVRKVVTGGNDHFTRFLELLAERHRLPVIFRIRRAFDALWAKENKLLPVEIKSAVELEDDTVKKIAKRIEEETGQKIELTRKVDPDVVAGLVIQVGNRVLDASVRARLEQLRKTVAKAA
jgi:F-type H+-transporting ATPase subunit delta